MVVPLQVDLGASMVPDPVFTAIHLAILLAVALFASYSLRRNAGRFAAAFAVLGLGEISYIGYHVDVTTFLLSHTVSEVLVLVAAVLVFLGVRRHLPE